MALCDKIVRFKAINANGMIESLYDVFTEEIFRVTSNIKYRDEQVYGKSRWKVIPMSSNLSVIEYLQLMKFHYHQLESIICDLVQPSGLACFLDHIIPNEQGSFILYYSCLIKENNVFSHMDGLFNRLKLNLKSANGTHLISKVRWGFEILFVVSLDRKHQNNSSFYQNLALIFARFDQSNGEFQLNEKEIEILRKLSIIQFYSSTRINRAQSSLITIFDDIKQWQKDASLHKPIEYELFPLNGLLTNLYFRQTYELIDRMPIGVLEKIRQNTSAFKILQNLMNLHHESVFQQSFSRQQKLIDEYKRLAEVYRDIMAMNRQALLLFRKTNCSFCHSMNPILDGFRSTLLLMLKFSVENERETMPYRLQFTEDRMSSGLIERNTSYRQHRDSTLSPSDLCEFLAVGLILD